MTSSVHWPLFVKVLIWEWDCHLRFYTLCTTKCYVQFKYLKNANKIISHKLEKGVFLLCLHLWIDHIKLFLSDICGNFWNSGPDLWYFFSLKCQVDLGVFNGKMVSYVVVVFVRLTHTRTFPQCSVCIGLTCFLYIYTEACMCLFSRLTTDCVHQALKDSVALPFSMIRCVFHTVCEARLSQKC